MNSTPLDNIQQPWVSSPYSLISWWDMERFSATAYVDIISQLHFHEEWLEHYAPNYPDSEVMSLDSDSELREMLEKIRDRCQEISLTYSANCATELLEPGQIKAREWVRTRIEELRRAIRGEMKGQLFFYMLPGQALFYDQPELYGVEVNAKFPTIQYDMVEAGNCLAMGRSTACVFHLMRIMEVGVQQFGSKLGVALASEKNWQIILDQTNAPIKQLPAKDPKTIEISQAAANLYSVKLAWRNQVMHPHDKYTLEEAKNLIGQVKIFISHLATII